MLALFFSWRLSFALWRRFFLWRFLFCTVAPFFSWRNFFLPLTLFFCTVSLAYIGSVWISFLIDFQPRNAEPHPNASIFFQRYFPPRVFGPQQYTVLTAAITLRFQKH
jgi:hypothetical protein